MSTPRLLLFGNAGAGKSALLGALVETAPELKAEVAESSDGVQHFHVKADAASEWSDVAVLDCSGTSASEMLKTEVPFADWHPLNATILGADAILVIVDLSAPKKQRHEDFRQVARWLKHLHETRGQLADIAALPIYIVLTKCDQLARNGDTLEAWLNRLEDAKHQYQNNFQKFLKEQTPVFGTLNIKVVATSTQPPSFGEKAGAKTPFGVAELFRESLQSARDFQERRNTAQSRMQNLVVALLAVVAMLGLSVALLIEFQPGSKSTSLDEKVQEMIRLLQAKPAERLRGGPEKLEARLKKLTEIETHAEFKHLPGDYQKMIKASREEIAEYLPLYQSVLTVAFKLPKDAKDDDALKEQQRAITPLALPETRAKDWADTDLAKRVRRIQGEYEILHAALKKEADDVRKLVQHIKDHEKTGKNLHGELLRRDDLAPKERKALSRRVSDWQEACETLLTAELATKALAPILGLTNFTYNGLGRFEPAKSAHREWEKAKASLDDRLKSVQRETRVAN